MKSKFTEYLIKNGYKQFTPKGYPSTAYDYPNRIEKVLYWEKMTWEELAENIDVIKSKYDINGEKSELGKKSHNAVISALRRFYEFCDK